MNDAPRDQDDQDDRAWWAELLDEVGPEGARRIADLLGIEDV